MALSKKITAVILFAVIIVCMSGYINSIIESITENEEPAPASEDIPENSEEDGDEALSFADKINGYIDEAENSFNDIAFKIPFIELNGLINKAVGKRAIIDAEPNLTVYKYNNGHLSNISSDLNKNYDGRVQNIISLRNFTNDKNIDYLYVNIPFKTDKANPELPEGIIDNSNILMDGLVNGITEAGVSNIDLRQVMHDEGINQYDMFFKTDHHWKPETGLWAVNKINEYLVSEFAYEDKSGLLDIKDYNIDTYNDIFLGSLGRRTSKSYSGIDDLSLIYPKFPTNLTFSIPSKEISREGKFEDTIFDYKYLNHDYYDWSAYSVYTGGDHPYNKIINNNDKSGKKALLIRDSFSCVTAPFLSLCFSELHIFDMRYDTGNSMYEHIEKINPDLVITAYNGDRLWGGFDYMFQFDKVRKH